ncbi:hypothetical protein [Fructobacillus fructosus]|uniref:hypothetical protein n=1 Tax=Fructobacillus fructosus TaxID=1631 RepID=UPI0016587534|nr:hypothetical protein [Fructobacillus fructosus]MBC9119277.1 hypothetical protein [Fructobacillus fructosus]MBD9366967.1 hypothetical protein [Leuconostoc mesenteroides]
MSQIDSFDAKIIKLNKQPEVVLLTIQAISNQETMVLAIDRHRYAYLRPEGDPDLGAVMHFQLVADPDVNQGYPLVTQFYNPESPLIPAEDMPELVAQDQDTVIDSGKQPDVLGVLRKEQERLLQEIDQDPELVEDMETERQKEEPEGKLAQEYQDPEDVGDPFADEE